MTDAAANTQDVDNLRQAMRDGKGPGNFRNLFMYSPNGKKNGIQIRPVSDVAAKDEFFNIKSVTRDDHLAAHRVLLQPDRHLAEQCRRLRRRRASRACVRPQRTGAAAGAV